MKITHQITGTPSPGEVLRVLKDLEGWSAWMTGVNASEVVHQTNAVVLQLAFETSRPVSVSVDVTETREGLRFRMVEGDLTSVDGEISVHPHAAGCVLSWQTTLAFHGAIPGTLLAEFEREVIPGWCEGLLRAARRGSDRSGS